MRIRSIKPEFFLHEGLYELERETNLPIRLAFAGLWCAADREGRFKWEPRRLGVSILPYDGLDFSRVLHALTTRGFLVQYRVKDACFGHIPSFPRHQVINNRERGSDIPEPPQPEDIDASTTREARVDHASKEEGKGREGNMEEKGEDALPPASEALPRGCGRRKPAGWPTSEAQARSMAEAGGASADLAATFWHHYDGMGYWPQGSFVSAMKAKQGFKDQDEAEKQRLAPRNAKAGTLQDKDGTVWTTT